MREPAEERFPVSVPGATLGVSAEGTGIPVLVVGSSVYYPRTFSRRLRKHCRLAFADLRHFAAGDSALLPGELTFGTYADDIERVRRAVGFDRAVVVGHSKHGNIAVEYAKRYPERVSHVVMIGSPPVGIERVVRARDEYWRMHASEERKAALARNRAAHDRGAFSSLTPAEALVARYVADGPLYWFDPEYDASPLWSGVPVNTDVLDAVHGLFSGYELSWDPGRMPAPVLVAMGRYDFAVPPVLWDKVLPRLGPVTFRVFENSGHTPQLEEGEAFERVLLEWLRTEPPGGGSAQR